MPKTAAAGAPAIQFERIHAQATESVRRDARRVRDLADRFRGEYREQPRGLDATSRAGRSRPPASRRATARGNRTRPPPPSGSASVTRMSAASSGCCSPASSGSTSPLARWSWWLTTWPARIRRSRADAWTSGRSRSAAGPLRIIQAQEGERQRLAEEVHDGPAQVLTNAIFQVEYLDRVIDDSPETAHAELAFLRTMLREGLDEVRCFITELRPPTIDVGLEQAITEPGPTSRPARHRRRRVGARHRRACSCRGEGTDAADRAGSSPERSQARGRQPGAHQRRGRSPRHRRQRSGLRRDAPGIGASRNFGLQFMRERAELMEFVSFTSSPARGRGRASCSSPGALSNTGGSLTWLPWRPRPKISPRQRMARWRRPWSRPGENKEETQERRHGGDRRATGRRRAS